MSYHSPAPVRFTLPHMMVRGGGDELSPLTLIQGEKLSCLYKPLSCVAIERLNTNTTCPPHPYFLPNSLGSFSPFLGLSFYFCRELTCLSRELVQCS